MGETEKNNPEKNVIYKYDALIRMNIWEQQGSKTRSPHYSKKTLKHYGANTNTRGFTGAKGQTTCRKGGAQSKTSRPNQRKQSRRC